MVMQQISVLHRSPFTVTSAENKKHQLQRPNVPHKTRYIYFELTRKSQGKKNNIQSYME